MQSGIINLTSSLDDIKNVLAGVWNQYTTGAGNEWTVVKTPYFIHLEGVLEAGRHELPFAPRTTKALYWTSANDRGSLIIKAGDRGFDLPENAFCEINIYGNT